jgi:hypothetical protein
LSAGRINGSAGVVLVFSGQRQTQIAGTQGLVDQLQANH